MTGWAASASAVWSDESSPARALDGDPNTHWESGAGQIPGMWFEIDMLSSKAVFAVQLSCASNDDYPRNIRAIVSEDGKSYSAATATVGGTKQLRLDFGRARVARYIRLEVESDTNGTWWRIDELRVLQ
jgi:hypothetical protein